MRALTTSILLAASLAGCANYDPARNLYEGIRQQQRVEPVPQTWPAAESMPEYERYKREREAASKP